jgi:ferrous iron transport protein B
MNDPLSAAPSSIIALVGNPNSGKTTLFNALTGLRHRIGNYPGVTVERKEGRAVLGDGTERIVLDLPGTYSLMASSPDERITTEIILGQTDHTPRPAAVVCVIDACALERSLYLVSQLLDLELPLVIALNMMDAAARDGIRIDVPALSHELGVPVVPLVASQGKGIDELRQAIVTARPRAFHPDHWPLPEPVLREWEELAGMLREHHGMARPLAFHTAMVLLSQPEPTSEDTRRFSHPVMQHLDKDHQKLDFLGYDRQVVMLETRQNWSRALAARLVSQTIHHGPSLSDRIDRIVTHRVWGLLIFFALMGLLFQAIFSWAEVPMTLIGSGFDWIGHAIVSTMPPGQLRDLIINGALAGVAAVVLFLPQILFLFLFLGLLEDTGYMARAAFVMDRSMRKIGLHGKSFIPLLSSFACAIPGIMATRTIENNRDRLATMLVAPLMSCSARLPVYALLIAATIPATSVLGFASLPALVLFAMYVLGLGAAVLTAWMLKKTLLRGTLPVFIMEMPPYRIPSATSVLLQMGERALVFLKRAGTIILGASIILWFLATYPKTDGATRSERLQQSYAGRAGKALEPLIAPLGFDWKIGIGLVSSLFQREMFVSTMGTIYNVETGDDHGTTSLRERMQSDVHAGTGKRVFTPLTGICLMVYYVLAMQCLSTIATMRRETNGWTWPLFQIGYMTALAYAATFVVYRAGLWLGSGG